MQYVPLIEYVFGPTSCSPCTANSNGGLPSGFRSPRANVPGNSSASTVRDTLAIVRQISAKLNTDRLMVYYAVFFCSALRATSRMSLTVPNKSFSGAGAFACQASHKP